MLKYVSTPMPLSYSTSPSSSSASNNPTMFDVDLKRQSSSSTSSDSISLNSSDSISNGSSSIMNDSIESPITHHHHHSNHLLVPVVNHHHHHHHHRSWSSSSSSTSSLPSLITDNVQLSLPTKSINNNDDHQNKIVSSSPTSTSSNTIDRKFVIKIFTRVLCTDVEYKTLSISNHTTSQEIVQIILKKFRLNHLDPNLFYLTLEAWIKQTGIPIRSVMALDDDACPALLQSCYRQKDLKFTLVMRRGENVRIHNQCKHGPSTVNILISERTNVEELTHLVTGILDLPTIDKQYELYVYSPSCKIEQKLSPTDRPLAIRMEWPNQDFNRFEIRPSSCRIQHHHQYIDNNNNNNSSNDSRLIMADFRKNFKSEFTMNLLGAATTTTNHNSMAIATENRNHYHHHNHHYPHYRSHPQLQLPQHQHSSSSSSTTTTTTTTTGKVLYI
ncbi:hypothetical protein DERF_012652 [Dermatophagoides farinae]|uniref:Ras-associating domain-containing protein n=1 Tax=Dermatophagoides farinae TaxID=6954 RepID=A0A922L0H0_DERFA|nr:hypothetical protein DERF_012652 [Dermatophagoides farinae]